MDIALKRAYAAPSDDDGRRYLVDRIWPRGVSKSDARLDDWLKEIAPSDALRRWFNHDPERWDEFRQRYFAELKAHHELLRSLAEEAQERRITLVYGTRDEQHNQALALRQYLERLAKQ